MKINFVMSEDKQSGILSDFNNYFKAFLPEKNEIIVTNQADPACDVFHYHRPNLCKEIHKPSMVTIHHDPKDTDRWLDWSNFHSKYRQMDHIVCLNNGQREFLISQGFDGALISVIPHGVNPELISVSNTKSPKQRVKGKFTIGIISKRYGRRVKGEAYFLELSKRLDNEKFKFLLIGENRDITATELESFGFEVQSFDFIPYRIIQSVYQKIDALLITSLFEGGPANLPEALATRTPIFTTPVGMTLDLIDEGINGQFLTGDYDYDAKIIEEEIGKFHNITDYSLEHLLTWQDVVLMYSGIYESLHHV
jgi:glycosyltransferase involved in cell wall biosynthesis